MKEQYKNILVSAVTALVVAAFLFVVQFNITAKPAGDFGVMADTSKFSASRDGSKLTVLSGGELEMQPGSTLDIQAGSSESHPGTIYGGTASYTNSVTAQTIVVTGTGTANGWTAIYLTGTVGTANQPNITNLGTQTYLTATNASLTSASGTGANFIYITGTVGTANQPNVTNLGTQVYLSATNFSLAGSAQKWGVSGTQGTYTSGDSISFTAPTTPTKCFMNPSPEITATYTITSAGFSVNTTTRSTPVYWQCTQ